MSTPDPRAGFWTPSVWASIDEGVTASMGAIRVAQKVFPTWPLPKTTSVPADIFDFNTMSIAEGVTLPYIEPAVQFSLTSGQVKNDPSGSTAITLAKLAAKSLALAEDTIFLQGGNADLPQGVQIESGGNAIGQGLLGLVNEQTITVQPPDPGAPTNSGGEILAAIAQGIKLLTNETQGPPFALIEDTNAWAATWGSVINGEPAYSILNQVLTGGIYGTGAMPPDTGLLIALGGDPTTIYIGTDAVTEPTAQETRGLYFFRTFEDIQLVARDQRAFVRLDFSIYLTTKENPSAREPRRSPNQAHERSRPGGRLPR